MLISAQRDDDVSCHPGSNNEEGAKSDDGLETGGPLLCLGKACLLSITHLSQDVT